MTSRLFRLALVLGLITAIGPFAIDMYLPALPAIGTSLNADSTQVQMSLTVFFLAIGIGQLLYGPVSDMVGRKAPLYFGLALYAMASVGCALARDVETLVAFRFVQGLGAAAGMAIPRAVVRDLHTGNEAARLMSLLMLVFSVSPILAPLAGSGLIALGGWRVVFWFAALAGVAGLALTAFSLAETRDARERLDSTLAGALRAYLLLLRDPHYLGLVFIGSFAMGGFFVFLSSSSFVFIDHYGFSPTQYSLAFGVNAAAFIGAAQFTAHLGHRLGLVTLVRRSALACAVDMAVLLGYFLLGGDDFRVLMALYFVASAFMGWVIPSTSVLALDTHGSIAGTASALMGTLQMLTGALMMGLVSLFAGHSPVVMVSGMAAGVFVALALTWMSLRGPARLAVGQA
ncbi:multidrug effflux MFS transporter [Variovorax dokdonensis]|uniref:Bcr/CflA family efflux transporter n=1 Tax=Variovorax dokdonensis TaxID=344883 RepID=A0ABT7NH31_9BURK|nr:multidrug effflux MFS transporter [Variovorax dokdonensis]MDM0047150.1 multidrug effflux MFS transporter [Variovorax dokdonensis]